MSDFRMFGRSLTGSDMPRTGPDVIVGKVLRSLALLSLGLYSIFALKLVVFNFANLVEIERNAIGLIQRGVESGAVAPPAGGVSSGLGEEVSLGPFVSIPAWLYVVISVLAGIWAILMIPTLIEEWKQVIVTIRTCGWGRSFWSFLGCLWTAVISIVGVLIKTIFIILLIVFMVINIIALILVLVG
jgi:hypothetical protein